MKKQAVMPTIPRAPKYRYRILNGQVKQEVESCIRAFSEHKKCEVVELNIQIDHVHLIVSIPPKISVSTYVGMVKGRTAIRVLQRFKELIGTIGTSTSSELRDISVQPESGFDGTTSPLPGTGLVERGSATGITGTTSVHSEFESGAINASL